MEIVGTELENHKCNDGGNPEGLKEEYALVLDVYSFLTLFFILSVFYIPL